MSLTQSTMDPAEALFESLKTLGAFRADLASAMDFTQIISPAVADRVQGSLGQEVAEHFREKDRKFEDLTGKWAYLNELCVVRLWTVVEVMAADAILYRMRLNNWWQTAEVLQGLKANVVQFALLDEAQQVSFLRDELRRAKAPSAKGDFSGVQKFVGLFDLEPRLTPDTERCLLHLSAARNVIVHRHGFIDARYLARCPWVGGATGDRLGISDTLFTAFVTGALAFATGVTERAYELGLQWVGDTDLEGAVSLHDMACSKADKAYRLVLDPAQSTSRP